MADEKTFAQQSAMQPELSESDRIRDRIQNYQAQLKPQTLNIMTLMIDSQLKAGMIKPADLDAIVMLRDEVNKASIDYNTQVQNAQKRLTDLAEIDMAEKVAVEEAKMQAFETKLSDERQLRKVTQDKLAQMEAVLASHGISMDLNQDGIVGLQEGQVARELSAEEQAEIDAMVQVEKNNIAEAPVQPSEPSRAFQMARAMNPTVTDEQMAEAVDILEEESIGHAPQSEETFTINPNATDLKLAEAKKSFKEWDESQQENEFKPTGTTTESFMDEVERVNEVSDADQMELDLTPTPSAPVVSAGQVNEEQAEELTEENPEFVLSRETIKVVDELPEEPEEEYEEVTIPSESDLKSMTKSQINEQASVLDFDVPTTLTKVKMIEEFTKQTDEFIKSLQESGEFVSAIDNDEDGDDKSDIQDGGYF